MTTDLQIQNIHSHSPFYKCNKQQLARFIKTRYNESMLNTYAHAANEINQIKCYFAKTKYILHKQTKRKVLLRGGHMRHFVPCYGLWQLLRKYGFTTMIEALHTGMMANVSVGGEVSESFSFTNVVKQGCVLAPTLFSIFLSAMLDEAFRDMGDGVYIQSSRALTYSTSHTSERIPRLLRY